MREHDLIIVGTGSGNSIPGPEFDDWDIAIVEKGVFGGTCLNVGCIPSKMFVYAADVAETIRHAATYNIDAQINSVDWPSLVNRVFNRIDPIASGGEQYRVEDCNNITVYPHEAVFTGPKVLEVGGEQITAKHIVLAAGARVVIPEIPGIEDIDYYTSDTIMRIPEVPERLAIIGGGYIGAELGHVFAAMGSRVTMLVRSGLMLRQEDEAIAQRATDIYSKRMRVRTRTHVERAYVDDDGIVLGLDEEDVGRHALTVDAVLIAAGRIANGDTLHTEAGGIEMADRHRINVDAQMRTNVDGVWALGDIANPYQLKHIANVEAKIVSHNLRNPGDLRSMDYSLVPHAVFGHPQIASVGLTEEQAAESGVPYIVATQDYGGTAYGWAMEDRESFAKLIAHRETRRLIGAHIIGPQASSIIQPLVQGMRFDQTVDEMAEDVIYIHPALTEVIENALLQF